MRVLIFGGTGFCGAHLARRCIEAGEEVFVTGRRARPSTPSKARFIRADTLIPESLEAAIEESRPQRIYHLAGLASVARSFEEQEQVYQVNVLGTFHVLKAIREFASKARVLVVGSAEEYGAVEPERLPIREDAPLAPRSPYGVSRVASTLMSLRETKAPTPLELVATRTFNLTGPGQSRTFVCSDFASQIAAARLAGQRELLMTTGSLEVRRDFSSVIEGVEAYYQLMERGEVGRVYNVCSGRALPITSIISMLSKISGLELRTQSDPARMRASEIKEIRGDPRALYDHTGVELSEQGLEDALQALFEDWLQRSSSKET